MYLLEYVFVFVGMWTAAVRAAAIKRSHWPTEHSCSTNQNQGSLHTNTNIRLNEIQIQVEIQIQRQIQIRLTAQIRSSIYRGGRSTNENRGRSRPVCPVVGFCCRQLVSHSQPPCTSLHSIDKYIQQFGQIHFAIWTKNIL